MTNAYYSPHPTPAQIQAAIMEEIHVEDDKRRAAGEKPVEVAVWRLVRQGVQRACNRRTKLQSSR